jgi:putative FmdB family regulatory protein
LYEFECESCHRRFERIQKFSDPSPETCPHCGKGPVRKLMSTPAIQFKGSGFYITDYGKKGDSGSSGSKDSGSTSSGKESKDASSSKSDSGKSESTKSESTKSESSKSESSKSESSKSDTSSKKE